MAFPEIVFNWDEGYDDYTASGAGPFPALTGNNAHVPGYVTATVGLCESSTTDLSEVNTDGSHAIIMQTSSGRKWFKITGKRATRLDDTGDMTASDDTLSNMSSTTGWSVNDVVRVVGAGAAGADLYSTIKTVLSSTSLELWQTASTTVTGAAVRNFENVTISPAAGSAVNGVAWAIGGKRCTLSGNTQLGADLKAGWGVALEWYESAYSYHFVDSATLTLTASGDTTDGRITIRGTGAGRPFLKVTGGSAPVFTLQGDLYRFQNLGVDDATELILVNNDAVKGVVYEDLEANANADYLVRYTSAVTQGRALFISPRAITVPTAIKVEGVLDTLAVDNALFKDPGGTCYGITVTGKAQILCRRSVFDFLVNGIDLGSTSGIGTASEIDHCTFRDCRQKCIAAGHVDRVRGLRITNCIMAAETYQLDMPSGTDAVKAQIDHNVIVFTKRFNNVSQGDHDIVTTSLSDPAYRGDGDYRIASLIHRANGWPITLPEASYPTPSERGAVQRSDPLGGLIAVRILAVDDDGTNLIVQHEVVSGANLGLVGLTYVPRDGYAVADTVHDAAVIGAVQAFMREGLVENMIGQEILA